MNNDNFYIIYRFKQSNKTQNNFSYISDIRETTGMFYIDNFPLMFSISRNNNIYLENDLIRDQVFSRHLSFSQWYPYSNFNHFQNWILEFDIVTIKAWELWKVIGEIKKNSMNISMAQKGVKSQASLILMIVPERWWIILVIIHWHWGPSLNLMYLPIRKAENFIISFDFLAWLWFWEIL